MMRSKLVRRGRGIRRTPGERVFDALNVVLMLILSFVLIYPFWYVLVYAFNESNDARAGGLWFWPRVPTLWNIRYVLVNSFMGRIYFNTFARTVVGSALHLAVTGLAAYALSKRYLPGRKAITYFLIVPMFIGGTIISYYIVMAKLHLLNNFLVYLLPGAFSFFMMAVGRAFIEEIPASLEESAKLDGAGYIRIFFRLVIPLCTPIIATILIFSAVGHWLDFFSTLLYITKIELYTLQFLLYRLNQSTIDQGLISMLAMGGNMPLEKITGETMRMTTLVVVTLPILFVYPFFQKYIIKGVLLGAIKE